MCVSHTACGPHGISLPGNSCLSLLAWQPAGNQVCRQPKRHNNTFKCIPSVCYDALGQHLIAADWLIQMKNNSNPKASPQLINLSICSSWTCKLWSDITSIHSILHHYFFISPLCICAEAMRILYIVQIRMWTAARIMRHSQTNSQWMISYSTEMQTMKTSHTHCWNAPTLWQLTSHTRTTLPNTTETLRKALLKCVLTTCSHEIFQNALHVKTCCTSWKCILRNYYYRRN